MTILKDLFKQKETKLGIAAAIAFQIIFVIVWLTGYEGVNDRIDQFSIGIVNDDAVLGMEITDQLENNDAFKTILLDDVDVAKKELDMRDIQMLIHLPSDLSEHIQNNEQVTIDYYINQSVPTLEKQVMGQMASSLNEEINKQAEQIVNVQLAEQIPTLISAQSDQSEFVEQIAKEVVSTMQTYQTDMPVHGNIIKTNDKEGFVNTMIPLLIILASYIGSMLVSQHLQLAATNLKTQYHVMSLFAYRQFINLIVAVFISLLTVFLIKVFSIEITQSFFTLWLFQTIVIASFLVLSQMFVFLFGQMGMVFNIALTALQLVSSGAIVPQKLLSTFYQKLGSILPATYGVNGYLSFIYGGGDIAADLKKLLMIIVIILLISVGLKMIILALKGIFSTNKKAEIT